MINEVKGNILDSDGLIFIPVNMVGVLGAGLAKQWANIATEEQIARYVESCQTRRIFDYTTVIDNYLMIPTKNHWRGRSDWTWIEPRLNRDLTNLAIGEYPFKKWAVPRIGCGLGGLDWDEIKPKLIERLEFYASRYKKEVDLYV